MKIKEKIIATIISSVTVFIIIIVLVILPFQNKNVKLKEEILNNYQNISDQQTNAQNILKSYQKFKKLDQNQINNMFLESNNPLYFINTIEEIAQTNNCLLTLNISEPNKQNYYEIINVQLTLQGNLNDIKNFLNKLEEQNFYINYQKMSIAPASTSPITPGETKINNDHITINLDAKTFWRT